jgi:bacterioferritin
MTRMYHNSIDHEKVIAQLNKILEAELAGAIRYTHHSLMVFGYSRIPIVSWLRSQSQEAMLHAQRAGEMITRLGGHPSLGIGPLLETRRYDIGDIMREILQAEYDALDLYYELLQMVEGKSVPLEEYARELIQQEEMDIDEIDKMLRKPGDINISKEAQAIASQ